MTYSIQSRMKKLLILIIGMVVFIIGIGIVFFSSRLNSSRKLTFEECQNAGGAAWVVDLYHPDICPSCAEYFACEQENSGAPDIREVCPQAFACTDCLSKNFPYPNKCPDGKKKIGEISDAETWFQCCK